MRALPLVAAMIVMLAACTARAQGDIARTVTGNFRLADKPIPLPAGEWHLVAE